MSLRRKIFYAFTLAVVAALLVLPATGWLARLQLLPFTLRAATVLPYAADDDSRAHYETQVAQTVAASGNDFTLRYAHAMNTGFEEKDAKESLSRLDALQQEYPRNPVVLAAILNTMTHYAIKMNRPEEDLLSHSDRRGEYSSAKQEQSDPAQLAKFVALAETGEDLEPDNAYFTVMAAWGYFASKQDEKATAAWIRAGAKSKWNDHSNAQIGAKWALQRALNGGNETGAIARMGSMAGAHFSHYAGMRSSARMATVMALRAEQRGDKESGFVIRQASRRIGQNLQANSKSSIGNMVGGAIAILSLSRYGGEESVSNPYKDRTRRNAG